MLQILGSITVGCLSAIGYRGMKKLDKRIKLQGEAIADLTDFIE